jgi:hypothetical protein
MRPPTLPQLELDLLVAGPTARYCHIPPVSRPIAQFTSLTRPVCAVNIAYTALGWWWVVDMLMGVGVPRVVLDGYLPQRRQSVPAWLSFSRSAVAREQAFEHQHRCTHSYTQTSPFGPFPKWRRGFWCQQLRSLPAQSSLHVVVLMTI